MHMHMRNFTPWNNTLTTSYKRSKEEQSRKC